MLKQTPLNEFHRDNNGRMVDFAGWEMPVVYTGIIEEHHYTRNHVSLFDVSHMGRVEFRGSGAGAFLEKLVTRKLGDMKPGQCRYGHVCREDGGMLDDVIVSRYETHWFMVCNASNREKLLGWFDRWKSGFDVQIVDQTLETAMIALQGPDTIALMDQILPFTVSDLKRYHFKAGSQMGMDYYVARSGYTGEDGIEAIFPAKIAAAAVQLLMANSADVGKPVKPAGLGARDTLRLEAAMPLYGHELAEEWDSLTAGQAWCVDLTKDFVGVEAMRRVKESGLARQIVGFEIDGKRIARQGATIVVGGEAAGVVTSGTMSPTFDKVIGLGLLSAKHATPGTAIEIDLRGSKLSAKIVPTPFYKRPK